MIKQSKYIVEYNGARYTHTSVCCIAILNGTYGEGYVYDKPILYIQTRRKVSKKYRKFKGQERVKEYLYPLDNVTRLI